MRQRLAFKILHHQVVGAVLTADVVKRADVRVTQTRDGSRFSLEYRGSLFEEESRGSHLDRFFSQLQQLIEDTEGGLFVMIGRKEHPGSAC